MNRHVLILVSSVPLREEHIINMKQMIGSHNKYLTFLEHTPVSPEKKKSILQSAMSKHNYFVKKYKQKLFLEIQKLANIVY